MNTQVIGNINVALVFGLLQFVSTFLIAYLYARYSTKNLDPLADQSSAPSSKSDEAGPMNPDHHPVPGRRRGHPGHHLLASRQTRMTATSTPAGASSRFPERLGHRR